MKPKKKTLGDVKRRINAMRNTKRQNPDGTVSTHKMAWGGNEEEGYSVYPTIFPNKDGSWTDYLAQGESRKNWDSTVDEAAKRNEIIGGLSKSMAEDLADGSWKNMGKLELKRKNIPSIMKAKKKYEKGGVLDKLKEKKGKKEKKPDYGKTETFQDYKSAAATFADYNPGTDTVFVGKSLDPGAASRWANREKNISAAKGASSSFINGQKTYKTKNENGQTVYVSLKKAEKKEYSEGGKMKAKKTYAKGGKLGKKKALDFNKDGKITKADFAMMRQMAKKKKK